MKTITASEAARKLGIDNASSIYHFCESGNITGFKRKPARDKYSNGKYLFSEHISWKIEYTKEDILLRCAKLNIPRISIRNAIGADNFNKFNESCNDKNYDYSSFMRPVFEMIKLGPR